VGDEKNFPVRPLGSLKAPCLSGFRPRRGDEISIHSADGCASRLRHRQTRLRAKGFYGGSRDAHGVVTRDAKSGQLTSIDHLANRRPGDAERFRSFPRSQQVGRLDVHAPSIARAAPGFKGFSKVLVPTPSASCWGVHQVVRLQVVVPTSRTT